MLLALDVGNTNTVLGLYRLDGEKPELAAHWRVTTHRTQTADEYGVLFVNLFEMNGMAPSQVHAHHHLLGGAAGRVHAAPGLRDLLSRSSRSLLSRASRPECRCWWIIPPNWARTGWSNAIAAFERYGGPCIVVDFGTATTFDVISAKGEYLGGAIAPGLGISADALFSRAARLSRVDIKRPAKVIGTNTVDAPAERPLLRLHRPGGRHPGAHHRRAWRSSRASSPPAAWRGRSPRTRATSPRSTTCSPSMACSSSSSATAPPSPAAARTEAHAVLNYFNYFTEIEERFQQRRGSLLLLSTLDWALIETWREAGIPLEAALRGIDAAFDKYEARQKRGRMRRINGLAWCAQAVMEAAEELREAAAGTATRATEPARIGL